jgi:hypothetical protein
VEAYRDAGGQLMGALEKTAEYAEGATEDGPVGEDLENQRSQQQLEQMMKGVR